MPKLANIYIHIEIAKRELEAKILLSLVAAERGHRVLIGNLKPLLAENILSPGIILDKALTPRPELIQQIKYAKENGHLFSSIDEEGGILSDDYKDFAAARYSEESIRLADAIFFWGKFDYSYINQKYPNYHNKYHLTGNVRADLWRPELMKLFPAPKNIKKPYILIPSNLGTLLSKKPFLEQYKTLKKATQGNSKIFEIETEKFFTNWASSTLTTFDFIRALTRLSHEYPEYEYVLRPHPTESREDWKEIIGDQENISIRDDGPISPWVNSASAIIHRGCTTAIEASLAKKAVINYRAQTASDIFSYVSRLGQQANSYEELSELIRSLKHYDANQFNRDQEILAERIENISGRLAADKIVDVWENIASNIPETDKIFKKSMYTNINTIAQIFDSYKISQMPLIKNIIPQSSVSWKFPAISDSELRHQADAFKKYLNRFDNVKTQKLAPRLYLFESEHKN